MLCILPESTVYRGLLQGGEGVLLARRMRMLCWWSKRLRCFDMVKDAFHPIVTSSFSLQGILIRRVPRHLPLLGEGLIMRYF